MSILLKDSKIIKTEEDFIKYTLRKMGGLKFSIEICRDNWDDIIGDVIDDVVEHGYNICYQRGYLPIILGGNTTVYDLAGQGIVDVIKIHTQGDNIFGGSHEGLSMYQSMMGGRTGNFINMSQNNMSGANLGNFADYIVNYSNYRTIQKYFKMTLKPRYNVNTAVLTLKSPPTRDCSGMMDCFILDPIEALYNNKYFKRLAEYWVIRQWKRNVEGKYKIQFAAGESTVDDVFKLATEDYKELIAEMKKESLHGNFRNV